MKRYFKKQIGIFYFHHAHYMFMKRFSFSISLLISGIIIFQTACKPADDTLATDTYSKGVYITNEGSFKVPGDVSFYNRNVGGITTDIFSKGNNGTSAGSFVQSMTYLNRDTAFVVVNGSNKILMINPRTFQVFDSISIFYPRYLHLINATRGYVSAGNGTKAASDSIYVLNFKTKTFLKSAPVNGLGPDQIISNGYKQYVINSGGYEKDSSVAIFDASTVYADTILTKIKVGAGPNSIVRDANGDIWVLCGGYYDQAGNGKLYQIRNDVVVGTFDVPKYASKLTIDLSGNNLYYLSGNQIFTKNLLNFTTNPPQLFMSQPYFVSLYGLAFDPTSGYMYCTDAKDFASKGSLYIFDALTKTLKDSVKVGVAPSNFSFN